MKQRKWAIYFLVIVIMVTSVSVAGCSGKNDAPVNEISVAIYPYVPNIQLFQDVLTRQWSQLEPDITLNFVEWDCYLDPEPQNIDVMMYDALFTSYLAENGYIQPISRQDIQNPEGMLPFAVEGSYYNGEVYGIPYLVCSYFLVHHRDDAAMCQVQNFEDLCTEIAARKAADPETGLLMNYSTDYAYHYLDALVDFTGAYTRYEQAPSLDPPESQVLGRLHQVQSILAPQIAADQEDALMMFRNGERFSRGEGCAYYGYSEDISFMDNILDDITIRTISFSATENIQLFFADIASVGAHVSEPEKKAACIKLINLISSEQFLQELCFGTGDAQYMLPARQNVYIAAQEEFPLYSRLYELAMNDRNQIFRFGPDIYGYLEEAYTALE